MQRKISCQQRSSYFETQIKNHCTTTFIHGTLKYMTKKAKQTNGNKPATQHDLSLLGGQLTERMNGIDKRFDGVDKRFDGIDKRLDTLEAGQARLERGLLAVLKVVEGIDQHLKEVRRLPERVERLERSVFRR